MAMMTARGLDRELRAQVADEIVNLIYGFAAAAAAAAFIPVPGLDVAAVTADMWIMYTQINRKLGISFSKNFMKSLGSAVIGNLTANLGYFAVGSLLKFIPGVGSVVGGGLMAATVFGMTVAAGWVYLKALSKFYESGNKSESALKDAVSDILKDDQKGIKDAFAEGKRNYKK